MKKKERITEGDNEREKRREEEKMEKLTKQKERN